MILLREIQERDLDVLETFSQIPGFINLTKDKEALREKIQRAQRSFRDQNKNKMDGKYIFVAEDLESHRVLGTSMIASQHGTVESPHFYFELASEESSPKLFRPALFTARSSSSMTPMDRPRSGGSCWIPRIAIAKSA